LPLHSNSVLLVRGSRGFHGKATQEAGSPVVSNYRKEQMTDTVEIVRDFYERLKAGDAAGALGLMAHDIEWITMWHYKVNGRGPDRVAEGLFKPLMAEWSSFALEPAEFIADGDTVVSLGHFVGLHAATGKRANAGYAHVWTVKDNKIARFRQYIDTLAIAEARLS
jgi:ketosteroid isomerase-like protein